MPCQLVGHFLKIEVMKVNIIKPTDAYKLGEVEVDEARGNYLIRVGVAEPVKKKAPKEKKEGNFPGSDKITATNTNDKNATDGK